MGTIEKAIKVAKTFIDYVKKHKQNTMEEIKIHSDQPNERFIVKIFITDMQEEVIFKKESTNAYIIISNGKVLNTKGEEEFLELLNLLEIAGVKLLQKTVKPKMKRINLKKRPQIDKKTKIDRLLDRYNDYQKLYELFGDEKYLKRKERLIYLIKNATI